MEAPKFNIKHIGINTDNEEQAQRLCKLLGNIFGLENKNDPSGNFFAGEIFEILKHRKIGENGHIALQTPDVEYAMAYLEEKGLHFKKKSFRHDRNGKIIFAYIQEEYGGFAFHLTL